MKKTLVKILSVAMALVIISGIATFFAGAVSKGDITFTVLGDSVAFGSRLESKYRFGDVLKDTLVNEGYNVTYQNYSVPKYSARSIYIDFFEDTFSSDYVIFKALADKERAEYGESITEALSSRDDLTYTDYINQIKASDFIVMNVGENNILATFNAMRGRDNYYDFYNGFENNVIFQQLVKEGKVDWMYKWNLKKHKEFLEAFESGYGYYLEEDIKELRKLNPTAQIIIPNIYNPYRVLSDTANSTLDLVKDVATQVAALAQVRSISDFVERTAKIEEAYNKASEAVKALIPMFFGQNMDVCGGLDISNLTTIQKIIYKIQYVRLEMCVVDIYKAANKIIANLCEKYDLTTLDMYNSNICYMMADDGAHPSIEGHIMFAGMIYDVLEAVKQPS